MEAFRSKLGNVIVHFMVGFGACDEFTVDEGFNALFDVRGSWSKTRFEVIHHFCQKLVVFHSFASLHYTHDGCFDDVAPIFIHLGSSLLPFRLALTHRQVLYLKDQIIIISNTSLARSILPTKPKNVIHLSKARNFNL